jgi:hypothetical protein
MRLAPATCVAPAAELGIGMTEPTERLAELHACVGAEAYIAGKGGQ